MIKTRLMRKIFTLVEVLVVVIIISILSSLAIYQFFRVAEKMRASEGMYILGILRNAQLRYYVEHGRFTNILDEVDVKIPSGKFFNLPQLHTPSYGDGVEREVVSIQRNNFRCGRHCGYTLKIGDETGKIICEQADPDTGVCPPGFASSF